MTSVSITQLKVNPMAVLNSADDYPVEIQNRSKIAGYFVGKNLFEKMVNFMEVIVTPVARKQIKKLPKFLQLAVIKKLKIIKSQPIFNSIKLSSYKDSYRVRIGNYRIVYRILKKDAYVIIVAHRKDVYLLLKKLFG